MQPVEQQQVRVDLDNVLLFFIIHHLKQCKSIEFHRFIELNFF